MSSAPELHRRRGLALRRRPWAIWSPASPAQLVAMLSAEVGTEQISPMEIASSALASSERERPLVIADRGASRSPWRFVFRGSMRAGEGGTWLTGDVGPSPAFLISGLAWMSVFAVFFLSGVVAVVVGAMSGQHSLAVPWILVPAVVLLVSYSLHHAAWTAAETRWRATEQWLGDLVAAPPSSA